MNDTGRSTSNGIGIGTITALVFVVLKLCHVIDWSWWWVLAPVWIPVLLTAGVFLIGFPIFLIVKKVIR